MTIFDQNDAAIGWVIGGTVLCWLQLELCII